jgi:hypothetical protein
MMGLAREGLRIGCGSAYADDDLRPALELAEKGNLDYMCFDCLAERTLSLAQVRKMENPDAGYDLRLESFMRMFLPYVQKGLKIIANMGAANPQAALRRAKEIAREMGMSGLRFAAVTGDDVLDTLKRMNPVVLETGAPLDQIQGRIVSANAYIGADPVVQALQEGADVVIGGRLADPSLFLAPMIHEFGWEPDDWERKGKGTVIGHLLECGTHLTGGNFADPPYRVVPGLDRLGQPIAEVEKSGDGIVTKLPDAGGMVTEATCKAQLVYEIHDPQNYLTPDVTCDVSRVTVREVGKDRVRVEGGTGREHPSRLKVLIGVMEGFMGEGEFSLAGPGAYERGLLALETLRKRYERLYKGKDEDVRFDLIGVNAIHGPASPEPQVPPYEVRVRVAMRTQDRSVAEAWAQETEWQYFGAAGSGGMRRSVKPVLAMYTTFLDRRHVTPNILYE